MIVLGLVVGLIARAVVPGRQPIGWIATALLRIVGAYVGGTLGSVVFPPHHFDIHPPIKHAFLGALVRSGAAVSGVQTSNFPDPDLVNALCSWTSRSGDDASACHQALTCRA